LIGDGSHDSSLVVGRDHLNREVLEVLGGGGIQAKQAHAGIVAKRCPSLECEPLCGGSYEKPPGE